MSSNRNRFLLVALFLLPRLGTPQSARSWHDSSPEDFSAGRLTGMICRSTGELILAPQRTERLTDERSSLVWSLVANSKGHIYAGTGNEGLLFRIADGKSEVVWDSDDPEIVSLAVDSADNVYAAVSPSGRIYRIPPQGQATLLAETQQTYVWAMASMPQGDLLAGTGPDGRILRIARDGKVAVVYDSPDPHVLCLALAPDGRLFAGTAGRGVILELKEGAARVACPTEFTEVRCMAMDADGRLVFGTAAGAQLPAAMPFLEKPPTVTAPGATSPTPQPSTQESPGTPHDQPAATKVTSSESDKEPGGRAPAAPVIRVVGQNSVYRLNPSGELTRLLTLKETLVYSIVSAKGVLHCGTGPQAGLFQLSADGQVTRFSDGLETNLMALLATPDGSLWIGAGYPGRVHQIRPGFVQEGLFISSVKDADLVSRFGQIGWRAAAPDGTGLRLSTRSGNVSLPDETWSDWSADYAEPSGQPVVSPAARFLQYRIKMTSRPGGATPSLQEVSITYSPRNLPPQITQLEFVGAAPAPAGAPSKKPSPGSPATLGSPAPSVTGLPELGAALAGAVSLKWSASDPNGDKLAATGFFRTKGSTPWKPLIPRNAATSLDWDTARLPDGWYEFRLVVDDQDSATRENGLSAEVITPPLLLDNAGPVFKDVRTDPDGKGQLTVSGVVEDALSYIAVASYSLDGQPWESLRPKDEILDGLREEVFGVLKDVSPGPHEFCLMAKDRAGNVAYHRIRIDAPAATSP